MSKIDDIFDDWDDEEEDITSVQTIYEYIEDRQKNIKGWTIVTQNTDKI